jgi:hypothetical protein
MQRAIHLYPVVAFLVAAGSAPASGAAPTEIAEAIVAACPLADPGNEEARQRCAMALAASPVLDETMDERFLWGGQREVGVYDPERSNLTRLDPLVWRRLYLSLFMFSGESRIEQAGPTTVIHLPARFRNALDAGTYPYPFWHSAKKWRHYEHSTEVLLLIVDGRLAGAMRNAASDGARPSVERSWHGKWRWDDGAEPRLALYTSLFSSTNPHTARVEAAYRRLEGAMRPYACVTCHSPGNPSGMNPLALLIYPNQALASRHAIVEQIAAQTMPPETADTPAGIRDPRARKKLLEIARAFERAAEDALAHEHDHLLKLEDRGRQR